MNVFLKFPPIFIIVLMLLPLVVFSQEPPSTYVVQGTVTDNDTGVPIPGANVYVKETKRGGITDRDGKFILKEVKEGHTLRVSFIGYKEWSKKFNGESHLEVKLSEDKITLTEIIAVGYGTQERRGLTGAVSRVSAQEISSVAPSFDNALIGKVAGMNINLSSGAPGSATAITIRGLSSLNADSNPLIVIDGVPVYGTGSALNSLDFGNNTVSAAVLGGNAVSNGFSQKPEFERNPLASLNPDDIESIEILKDAFSTAIYGSRGAAGVVLVTTKKGRKGKPQIKIGHSVQSDQPVKLPELLNADEFSMIYSKFNQGLGINASFPVAAHTDWLGEVIRTGWINETNASVAGGSDQHTFFLSFNRFDQQGYIINQDLRRNSVRTNFSFTPAKWINLGTNTTFSLIENKALNSQNIFRNAVLASPNIPVRHPDGSYFYHTPNSPLFSDNINSLAGHQGNPVATAHEDNKVNDTRVLGTLFAELKPFSWLSFKTEVGIDVYNANSYSRQFATPENTSGTGTASSNQNLKYVTNNVLTYSKILGSHTINAILGQSFETSVENKMRITATGFFDDNEKSIISATNKRVLDGITQRWAVLSYFSRFNYRYKNRYLAGLTYRMDGSSRFSKNRRYRGFPSVSGGWIISGEEFMKSVKWVEELKLRGSYGLTGLDGSFGGYYGNQGQWIRDNRTVNGATLMYNGVQLLFNSQTVNPNLEWETSTSLDLGLDASLFKGKMDLTLDYFYKRTNNLLALDRVPLYMGWSQQQQNVGDMKNEGFEFMANGTLLDTKNWLWTASMNVSRIRDKLIKLNEAGYQMANANTGEKKVFIVGESLNMFFLYDWTGVDPLTGNPQWRYSDGSVSPIPPQNFLSSSLPLANRFNSGSNMPKYYGGISSQLRFKDFELQVTCSYAVGQKMYNGTMASLMTYFMPESNNLSRKILNYWILPGHNTDVPALINETTAPKGQSSGLRGYDVSRLSDRFLEDGSYLRLRNITLAYRLMEPWLKKMSIDHIKIYAQGINLLTLTGYSGMDTEVNAYGSSIVLGGYDEITMPQAKSLKIGLELNF